jgi:YVTN family beta-propeller protein
VRPFRTRGRAGAVGGLVALIVFLSSVPVGAPGLRGGGGPPVPVVPAERSASSGSLLAPGPAGAPVGVAVDARIGPGAVATGSFPYGGAYDPANQELYIANQENDNVTVVNATTGAHVTDIPMTSDPLGAAYVGWNGLVYVIVEGSRSIEVVNTTTNTVNTTIALAADPEYVAYDPDNLELYLTEWSSYEIPLGVQEINTTTNTAAPVGTEGFDGPYCLAVDTGNDSVWVENLGNDSITVIAGRTNSVVGWLHPGPQPSGSTLDGGIAYSPIGNQMFVVNYATVGTMNVFGGSNYTLIASGIPIGAEAYGASLTFDPVSERVFVASYYADTITVVNVLNDSVAAPNLTVAGAPWVGIFDPTTAALFFLLSSSGGAAWIFGGIAVNFAETGLPDGTSWSAAANGSQQTSRTATMSFVEPVGNGPFLIPGVPGYVPAPPSGTFTVPSSPVAAVAVPIAFAPPTFDLEFTELGLPAATPWSVEIGSAAPVGGTAGAPIGLPEPNGTFEFVARSGSALYQATSNGSGRETVDGGGRTVNVTFSAVTYAASFTETGLPSETLWSVSIGSATASSETAVAVLNETNGSYTFGVGSVPGYDASPSSGSIAVAGANSTRAIVFTALAPSSYTVTFVETGLPDNGVNWSVTFAGWTAWQARANLCAPPGPYCNEISFVGFPNGNYSFAVGAPPGYRVAPPSGRVTVEGANLSESLSFTSAVSPWAFLGLTAPEGQAVVLGGIVLIVAAAAGIVLLRRRRASATKE